jgi:hypothetical protein
MWLPLRLWQSFCTERGIEIGTQKAFGSKLKRIIAWDPNNNRPRYLNVRGKGKSRPEQTLRVVASNP